MSRAKQGSRQSRTNLVNMSRRRGGNGSSNNLMGDRPPHKFMKSHSLGSAPNSDRYALHFSQPPSPRPSSKSLDATATATSKTSSSTLPPTSSSPSSISSAKIHPLLGTTDISSTDGHQSTSTKEHQQDSNTLGICDENSGHHSSGMVKVFDEGA